ncbi:MAG: hypothetical protein ABUM51_08090 [Bacteroidota bacterium]
MKKKIPLTYPLGGWLGNCLALYLLIFSACNNATPPVPPGKQDTVLGPMLPVMWVPKTQSAQQEAYFNLKYFFLNNDLQTNYGKTETDSIDIDVSAFKDMIDSFAIIPQIDSIDVYIAAYSDEKQPMVPAGLGNTLTLIFAPVDKTNLTEGYYTIPPGSKGFNTLQNRLRGTIAPTWMQNYISRKMPLILPTINAKDPDNYEDRIPTPDRKTFSDTRRIRYAFGAVKQLRDEITFQYSTNNISVTKIRAFFAAYPPSGNSMGKRNNRLIISYEFTRANGSYNTVFYLEDVGQPRPAPVVTTRGFDNGQLCPPACVPPPQPPVNP